LSKTADSKTNKSKPTKKEAVASDEEVNEESDIEDDIGSKKRKRPDWSSDEEEPDFDYGDQKASSKKQKGENGVYQAAKINPMMYEDKATKKQKKQDREERF